MERCPVTPKGLEHLRAMLKDLKEFQRPANVLAIEEARAHGDLKENAEYHAAKEKQSLIAAQIATIEDKLSRIQVVDPLELDLEKVVFGATVELLDLDSDDEVTYQIVGSDEADVTKGLISYDAPLARALIGKEEGDNVQVKVPKGIREYEVVGIEYK